MSGRGEESFTNLPRFGARLYNNLTRTEAMVEQAGQNLAGIKADLRQGNIRQTDYDSNFFDLVTCICAGEDNSGRITNLASNQVVSQTLIDTIISTIITQY